VVIKLFMFRICERFICIPMLCECLIYISCVVTLIQFYVMQSYVSVYHIVHVLYLWYSYMYLNIKRVIIILFMCRVCETVICKQILYVFFIFFICSNCYTFICKPRLCVYYIVHVSNLWNNFMYSNFMCVIIILFMRCICDTVICNQFLCEWLLYWSCSVSMILLYVTQYYVSFNYFVHVSYLWNLYM